MLIQKDLKKLSERAAKKILDAKSSNCFFLKPYKHLIIDNYFDNIIVENCYNNFPDPSDDSWCYTNDENIEVKYRSNWTSEFDIPDKIVDIIRIFNSSPVLNAIGSRLKIPKLIRQCN